MLLLDLKQLDSVLVDDTVVVFMGWKGGNSTTLAFEGDALVTRYKFTTGAERVKMDAALEKARQILQTTKHIRGRRNADPLPR